MGTAISMVPEVPPISRHADIRSGHMHTCTFVNMQYKQVGHVYGIYTAKQMKKIKLFSTQDVASLAVP